MTKTNRNFLIAIVSFVMIVCALFMTAITPAMVKADSLMPLEREGVFNTKGYVVDRQVQDAMEIVETPLRLYEDSFVEITGYNGAYLMTSYHGFSYMENDYAVPVDAPVEIQTCSGVDSNGSYVDVYFTREALSTMFGNSEEMMVYAEKVYILRQDLVELPDGPVNEPNTPSDDLTEENPGVELTGDNLLVLGGSVVLLVATVAVVINLIKKKKGGNKNGKKF